MEPETKILSIRLDARQAAYLSRLARESGRSQAQVVARLVTYANSDEGAQRFLGIFHREPNREPIKATEPR